MHIRKGRTSDFSRLERCDFSFTVSRVATGPFTDGDLHIEDISEPWLKIYELDIQTLEDHCTNPQALFLIAETGAGEIAGFITASRSWNQFITIDYIAIDSGSRRSGAARSLMREAHRWASIPRLRACAWRRRTSTCPPACSTEVTDSPSGDTTAISITPCRKRRKSPCSGTTCWINLPPCRIQNRYKNSRCRLQVSHRQKAYVDWGNRTTAAFCSRYPNLHDSERL